MSNDDLIAVYGPEYHDVKNIGSLKAARTFLPLVFDLFEIDSVVDVGCGAGTWLAAAKELGATQLTGVEGDWGIEWPKQNILPLNQFNLLTQNLEERLQLSDSFDLAICLETAEHLPQGRAATLIEDLCAASDRVLFSAAIPGQMGNRHINEQWQSYWAELFQQHGYAILDVIRPRFWADDSIPFWYRQNTLLYVGESERVQIEARMSRAIFSSPESLNLVHPELFVDRSGHSGLPWTLARAMRHPAEFFRLVAMRMMNRSSP